jgi:hypothetical protein
VLGEALGIVLELEAQEKACSNADRTGQPSRPCIWPRSTARPQSRV